MSVLETILKLYTTSMAGEVRSPVPHLFGPPGCAKSTFVEQAAELLNVNLHIINVSRISPLELEGVQMPDKEHIQLNLLTATFWTQLKEGDILLLDEFLRGFPEVYNGLLDILTSRRVGPFVLPKVFIIAASNTTVAYDKALEDRLLHITMPDPRSSKAERKKIGQVLIDQIGLLPEMLGTTEMDNVLDNEILPMYVVLDMLKNKNSVGASAIGGRSPRNLVGQAQLRHVTSGPLKELITWSNNRAIQAGKFQYVVLMNGRNVDPKYTRVLSQLVDNKKLTALQRLNANLNLQLISLEEARKEGSTDDDDDVGIV